MPLIYWLGIVLPYPLASGLADPRGSWVKNGTGSLPTLAWQILVYLLLTCGYVVALRLLTPSPARTQPQSRSRLIWLSWVLCSALLLFASPNGESHDSYDYLFRGRMFDRFGASPLVVTPNTYPGAPFYRYVAWKKHVDTYGPLWEYTSGATARIVRTTLTWANSFDEQAPGCPERAAACRTLAAYLTGYRLLAIFLTGVSGLLLQRIVRATQPTLAALALATWLWNPLLLIATALGAHNDALLLVFLFLTFWCWQRARWLAGWLAFGFAAQVKLTALLLVPVLGLWLVRKVGWARALQSSLLGLVLTLVISWLLYAPLGGWATLPRMLYERQLFVSHSLAQILYFLLYKWSGWPYRLVWQMMVPWLTYFFLAAATLLLLRTFLSRGDRIAAQSTTQPTRQSIISPELSELYRAATLLTLLYLLVGSFWFQPWYLLWVLAPAALWVDGRFPRQGLPWFCFGALCSNLVYDHLIHLPPAIEPTAYLYRVVVTVAVVTTIWMPLFVAQIYAHPRRS